MWLNESRSSSVFSTCLFCGYKSEGIHLRCPRCGGLTRLEYDVLRWSVDREVPSMWRYSSLLPQLGTRITHGEGFTPMRRLSQGVYIKLEDRNPTGSYADRASSIVASYMVSYKRRGDIVVSYLEDFTLSLTYYIYKYVNTIKVIVDEPSRVNPIEVVLLDRLGAVVEFTHNNRLHSLHYMNALTIEGLKTIAFEIVEMKPKIENVVVPTETGLLAYSILKGFREAREAGAQHSYSVVAVTLGDKPRTTLLQYVDGKVEVVSAESRDVIRSMIKLSKMGIWVKPLSAAALAEAENRGSSIALLTSSFKKPLLLPLSNSNRVSRLGEQVLNTLKSLGEATAYEIWEALERKPSLRGVYKALQSLEQSGRICVKYRVRGNKRVRTYSICGAHET